MRFTTLPSLNKREEADVLLIPFWEKAGKAKEAAHLHDLAKALPILETKDFTGKEGDLALLYLQGKKEKRALLVGLGPEEKITAETFRKVYGLSSKFCQKKRFKKINLLLPNIVELRKVGLEECLKSICEGILLPNYKWSLKSGVDVDNLLLEEVTLIGTVEKNAPFLDDMVKIFEGVYFARDLINGNASTVTPPYLAEMASKISERFSDVKLTVLDKRHLEKEKMDLLLAVGAGSPHDPLLIILEYRGHPKSKERTVLVGKGITYDTGGLNVKPHASMETMRDDMGGAATVLATLATAASLKLKSNIIAVVPAAENVTDGKSYKPGDVFNSHSGKSVEIKDTDAEGRLVLADAISYSIKYLKPTRLIDLATLTGSIVAALGEGMSGLFSNNAKLGDELLDASEKTGELLWKMPLHQPYKELLKSDVADLKNVGGRWGGAILAALFLEEFVGNIPWAHLDIAGTVFGTKEHPYLPKHGIGVGVRLLIEFFQALK